VGISGLRLVNVFHIWRPWVAMCCVKKNKITPFPKCGVQKSTSCTPEMYVLTGEVVKPQEYEDGRCRTPGLPTGQIVESNWNECQYNILTTFSSTVWRTAHFELL